MFNKDLIDFFPLLVYGNQALKIFNSVKRKKDLRILLKDSGPSKEKCKKTSKAGVCMHEWSACVSVHSSSPLSQRHRHSLAPCLNSMSYCSL